MSGACEKLGSPAIRRGLLVLCASSLVLSTVSGCGKEKRSGAISSDSSATVDTSARLGTDTAHAVTDTASSSTRDTTLDTTSRATVPAHSDTARPTTTKPGHRSRTSTTAKAPAAAPAAAATASSSSANDSGATETASAPLHDPYHHAPLDTVPQQVYDGWKQFNLNCARCHGEDAQGTTIAPHLIVSLKPDGPINTKEIFMQTVCAGRPAKGMPSWCSLGMEMSTIEAIYSYVKGRSDAKIHPGRPAVKSGG